MIEHHYGTSRSKEKPMERISLFIVWHFNKKRRSAVDQETERLSEIQETDLYINSY